METITSGEGDIRIVSTHGNVNGGSLEVDVSAEVEPPGLQVRSMKHDVKITIVLRIYRVSHPIVHKVSSCFVLGVPLPCLGSSYLQ